MDVDDDCGNHRIFDGFRNVSFILGQIGYFVLEGRASETFSGVVWSNVRLCGANRSLFLFFFSRAINSLTIKRVFFSLKGKFVWRVCTRCQVYRLDRLKGLTLTVETSRGQKEDS